MEKSFSGKIKEKELNQFIIIFLVLTTIASVFKSIGDEISHLEVLDRGSEYLAYILIMGTIINAFAVIYFIVYKKHIVGVRWFFGLLIIELYILNVYYGESIQVVFISATTKAILLSLILLLRRNGESAWKTLMRDDGESPYKIFMRNENQTTDSNKLDDEEFNPIWKFIAYTLSAILVVIMIIAIVIELV